MLILILKDCSGINRNKSFRGLDLMFACMQSPPPLDVPLEFIGKDPDAKEVGWEDDGVLVNAMDMGVF
jgi:hypothetical protein